jgi:probable rRNA maturation factor
LGSLAWLGNNKLSKVKLKQKKWLLNLILIDEKESQQLNKQYSQKNYPAKSLTFPFARFYQKELGTCEELGDIFLCYPLIQRQILSIHQKDKKIQFQYLLEREILLYFMHGVLHLIGCDHQTELEKKLIFALQEKIIDL